jgi:hypothetical protein
MSAEVTLRPKNFQIRNIMFAKIPPPPQKNEKKKENTTNKQKNVQ